MRMIVIMLGVFASLSSAALAQKRVVSVGGDLTEIIYALGEEDRLVATDSTSLYPDAANDTPKVGYVRRLSAEGVLSVEPDMILISGAAGPDTAVEQLEASGVRMIALPTDYTPASILTKVDAIGQAFGVIDAAASLREQIERDIERSQASVDALDMSPRILFISINASGAPQAAGKKTAAHGVIEMLGGENVFGDEFGYKALSLEAAVAADPDIILAMNHQLDRAGGIEGIRQHPALQLTTAASEGRVMGIDAVTIMQFGPRTPEAVAGLAADMASKLSN
ncbi:MAG: ABC transporter substrate-binding protein [Pseudomonadota bacterium]